MGYVPVCKEFIRSTFIHEDHFFLDECKDPYSTELLLIDQVDFGMKFVVMLVIQCYGTSLLVGGEMMAYSGNGISSS